MLNTFLEKTRRNAFIPVAILLLAFIVGLITKYFNVYIKYHDIYVYGQFVCFILMMLSLIFSVINGIELVKLRIIDKQRNDGRRLLVNLIPAIILCSFILYLLYILGSHFGIVLG